MLRMLLWSILAIWVGIALLILGSVVFTIVMSTVRMVRDRIGVKGSVYCPVHERTFGVVGVPTSFGEAPFDDLRRCEAFDGDPITCQKSCLKWQQPRAA